MESKVENRLLSYPPHLGLKSSQALTQLLSRPVAIRRALVESKRTEICDSRPTLAVYFVY